MAERTWEVSKVRFCEHVKRDVALEAEVLYPVDILPDPARVLSHRCSLGMECNQFAQPTCIWAGTNPDHDPLRI
jgi:hypothetical protein